MFFVFFLHCKFFCQKENLLAYLLTCYLIYNAPSDTATEKEFDIVIQMTLEHVLVQRFKKKEMDEKSNF